MIVAFLVQGRPQPQGSTRAFMPKRAKHPIITTDNVKLKPWRQDVASQAMLAMGHRAPFSGAVAVISKFYFLKPKSTKASIVHKITKPDLDKLERGIFDSLKGICFVDDSQVVSSSATKQFCVSNERAEVEVKEIEAEHEADCPMLTDGVECTCRVAIERFARAEERANR